MKYKKLIDELCKQIEQVSGVHLSFFGSNGVYTCSQYCPWSYLRGYNSGRDIYLFLDGLYQGITYNNK